MPVAINGIDKQGVYVNGVQVKQALDAANETVDKGVYDEATLSGVDADLAAGNIADGVNIFGFAGTVVGGGTETVEKYADATLADDASYTPGASGIFFQGRTSYQQEYYSTGDTAWYSPKARSGFKVMAFTAIGDGSNFRITNRAGIDREYILMRHFISTWTYERDSDADLAAGATYTPASSGFFAQAVENIIVSMQLQLTTAGWSLFSVISGTTETMPVTIFIGDGTNYRVWNQDGSITYRYVTMRAGLVA